MEFRKNIKIAIILLFTIVCVSSFWYIGVPKETEKKVSKEIDIPTVEAKTIVKDFSPDYRYYSNQNFVIVRNKTAIPFKYVNDTIYRSKVTMMKDIKQ
jgi:hypothetical protein